MTRTIPIYVNLDELDLITVCLMAALHHGGVPDAQGKHCELSEAGEKAIVELVERLTLLNNLELSSDS